MNLVDIPLHLFLCKVCVCVGKRRYTTEVSFVLKG